MARSRLLNADDRFSRLKDAIGVDAHRSNLRSVFQALAKFSPLERRRLLSEYRRILRDPTLARQEPLRVGAAKVIVALTPDSNREIKALLRWFSGPHALEVHFTLFCFLDQVLDLPSGDVLVKEIPSLVERYLMNVRSEAAQAAWMAGDLLGDHWPTDTAIAVLSRVALEARYVAGRKGAFHGLGHIMSCEGASKSARVRAEQILKDVSKHDKGATARQYAKQILDGQYA